MRAATLLPSTTSPSIDLTHPLFARIGDTPLIRLRRVGAHLPREVAVYAKAEWYNPAGSVKDRAAARIIRQAVLEGQLGAGRVLLDSTSGNMGIAYATFCAALGIPLHLAVPANAGPQRLGILEALGAELTLTDPLEGSDGARDVAAEIAASDPARYYYADQYDNPANWRAHYETTGPELLRQTKGRISHLVAGLGTTGTMTGVGRYLQLHTPQARLVAVQPDGPLHGLDGLKHLETSPVPGIFDPQIPDQMLTVRTEDAYAMARRLAREEGLLAGISSAAAMVAALGVAEGLKRGVIVALFPDSASKYLDLPFWSSVDDD